MNLDLLRKDFPILAQARNGHTLVYLDNAATTQKPRSVLEAEHAFYATTNANVHRGVYSLAREATELYLRTHHTVARFIHASSYREVIFTRNTTEALNLLARSLSEKYLRPGDHVVASVSDHHSNLIPWILLKERMGIHLHLLPVCEDGDRKSVV